MSDELPNYSQLKELTDREILILVVEKLRSVGINQCNHLKHHWAITLICITAGLMGLFNLGIAFVIIFIKGS